MATRSAVLLLLLGLMTAVLAANLDHLGHHHDPHHDQHDHSDQQGRNHGHGHGHGHDQHGHHDQRGQPEVPARGSRKVEAAPAPLRQPAIPIVRLNNQQTEDGSFQYDYTTANQIQVSVEGHQKQIGDIVGTVMEGHYSYVSPEGHHVRVNWTADENGFRAVGDNLGLPPGL